MAETKIDKKERKQLIVKWVGEPKPLPNSRAEVLKFTCEDNLTYETFVKDFFPLIQIGKKLDADTELQIITGKDGQPYTHWRVTQLYDEAGKPIAEAKKGGFQPKYGRDEGKTDFRTAIMETGQNFRAGLWKPGDPEVTAYRAWIGSQFKIKKTEETPQKAVASTAKAKPVDKPPDMTITMTAEDLVAKIREVKGSKFPVRSWLVNGPCKIEDKRIDEDPAGVWEEVSAIL